MSRVSLGIAVGLLMWSSAPAQSEDLGEKSDTYKVVYKDGNSERYIVKYLAKLDTSWSESGHPAIPLKGWPTDTRQCHWSSSSRVERQACLVSRAGQTFCDSGLTRVFSENKTGQGNDFKLLDLAPENCGKAAARRDSDFNNARTNVLAVLPAVAAGDRDAVKADLARLADVVAVNSD